MIDTSKFRKQFAYLDRDEKIALLTAMVDGEDCEVGGGELGWTRFNICDAFFNDYCMRTVPKPKVELIKGHWYAFKSGGVEYLGFCGRNGAGMVTLQAAGAGDFDAEKVDIIKDLGNPFE